MLGILLRFETMMLVISVQARFFSVFVLSAVRICWILVGGGGGLGAVVCSSDAGYTMLPSCIISQCTLWWLVIKCWCKQNEWIRFSNNFPQLVAKWQGKSVRYLTHCWSMQDDHLWFCIGLMSVDMYWEFVLWQCNAVLCREKSEVADHLLYLMVHCLKRTPCSLILDPYRLRPYAR